MKTAGERLDFIRKEIGLTYKDLGNIVDLTESGMRQSIKRDNLKPNYINLISDKTGINKEWLLSGKGEKFNKRNSNDDISNLNAEKDTKKIVKFLLDNQSDLLKSQLFIDFLNDCNREIQHKKIIEDNETKRAKAKELLLKKLNRLQEEENK